MSNPVFSPALRQYTVLIDFHDEYSFAVITNYETGKNFPKMKEMFPDNFKIIQKYCRENNLDSVKATFDIDLVEIELDGENYYERVIYEGV